MKLIWLYEIIENFSPGVILLNIGIYCAFWHAVGREFFKRIGKRPRKLAPSPSQATSGDATTPKIGNQELPSSQPCRLKKIAMRKKLVKVGNITIPLSEDEYSKSQQHLILH